MYIVPIVDWVKADPVEIGELSEQRVAWRLKRSLSYWAHFGSSSVAPSS